ncbi:CopD family protein [Nitrosomonas sp. ANs5]|uniref:CopD family protein n=1 Tax=Nitrosomonas sp. ANs5 TaxID=3423941 RepID=UPI003D35784A
MLWLLLLHISAVICWCGSLLYLPALIASTASQKTGIEQQSHLAVTLAIFRLFVTPVALITIASGTAIFFTAGITDLWLVLKLTLVTTLVLCHGLVGWLILRTQTAPYKDVTLQCVLLASGVVLLILAIIWVVLSKPF